MIISQIILENFKCFDRLRLPLAPLTLLSGFNGGGKSTSIQALLLLAQMLRASMINRQLVLNGPLTQLGAAREVLRQESNFKLGAAWEDAECAWSFEAKDRRQPWMDVSAVNWIVDGKAEEATPDKFPMPLIKTGQRFWSIIRLIYIGCTRAEQTSVYPAPVSDRLPDIPGIHPDVGALGEYAPWFLAQYSDEPVPSIRCHPDEKNSTLRSQVNAWANDLFPGVQYDANFVEKTEMVRLSIRRSQTDEGSRPTNVGYGITYALPIIVAGLLSAPGQLLIIDSPEAHLHPRAQSAIAKFLAAMVKAGIQVILETHSDHVLNGVRLAVKNGILSPEQAAIHFYTGQPDARGSLEVISANIDNQGGLSRWPKGFFDQAEHDLASLAGWC